MHGESILRNVMDKEHRVEDVEDISIGRAHRVGKPRSDGKPRPIIANLVSLKTRTMLCQMLRPLLEQILNCFRTS